MSTYPHAILLDELPLGIAILDRRGVVLGLNAELARSANIDPTTAKDRRLGEVFELVVEEARLSEALAADQVGPIDIDVRALLSDSDGHVEVQPIRLIGLPGKPRCVLGIFELVTPSVRAATRAARTSKHTLNNLLMGLLGHAEILQGLPTLSGQARPKVDAIMEQVKRIRTEVQTLSSIGHASSSDGE